LVQTSVAAHALPHAPQLLESVCASTQPAPQLSAGAAHTQAPAPQTWGEGQTTPTQLLSTHAPLTQTEPGSHVVMPHACG
jgi:hypothetical protein